MQYKPFSHLTSTAGPTNTLALLFAVLFTIAACATTTPPPPAQENTTTAVQEGVPGGVTVNSIEATAKVTAIDTKNRKVTLLLADGEKETVTVPPEAVNFDQVRVGDIVKATITEEVVVYLDEEGASVPDAYAAGVELAPKGTQPGGVSVKAVKVTATVMAIDQAKRTATVRFDNGTIETFPVRDDIDLSKRKVGEKVVFIVTQMIALSLEKP
jgi:Cu/Ag efflux protein CusF